METDVSLDLSRTLGFGRSLLIYYGQPWRRRALRQFYGKLVQPGDLVFDIGAHVGSRSRTLLGLGAEVVAVEPQPDFADFITRTLRHPKLTLLRKAIGREQGSIDLHISSRHPTVTSTSESWMSTVKESSGFQKVAWDRVERVEMTTLDQMVAAYGRPSLCKIDVEGAEADILRGLSTPLPLVIFEYIPAAMGVAREAMIELQRLGRYRFNRVSGEQHRFLHEDWISHDALLAELSSLDVASPSGDIYARLDDQ
jgi:FkbM family methyltransferase